MWLLFMVFCRANKSFESNNFETYVMQKIDDYNLLAKKVVDFNYQKLRIPVQSYGSKNLALTFLSNKKTIAFICDHRVQ